MINYIPEQDSDLPLDFVLALLNSRVLEWYFRLGSTNAHVNHYQVHNLPVPVVQPIDLADNWVAPLELGRWGELAVALGAACTEPGIIPKPVAEALAEMSRLIQEIEGQRVLRNRSERSNLAAESQSIQDAIDAILFRCFSLSEDEARYITRRLEEML